MSSTALFLTEADRRTAAFAAAIVAWANVQRRPSTSSATYALNPWCLIGSTILAPWFGWDFITIHSRSVSGPVCEPAGKVNGIVTSGPNGITAHARKAGIVAITGATK